MHADKIMRVVGIKKNKKGRRISFCSGFFVVYSMFVCVCDLNR